MLIEDHRIPTGEPSEAKVAPSQQLWHLRESEEKFRLLFERSADAQIIMKGGVFVEVNDALAALLGAHDKNQLVGLAPWEISPPKQPDGMESSEKALKLIAQAADGKAIRFEWIHCRVDGSLVPVEVSLTPVSYGTESMIHVAMRDISDRKSAEKELQLANQLFRMITDNTPDMIWIRDLHFRLTYVNNAVERIKGFKPEEARQRKLHETVLPETYLMYLEMLREELEIEQSGTADPSRVRRFESDEICRDGSICHTESLAAFIRDEQGQATAIVGITRDMTEKQRIFAELARAKDRAEESDRLKSAFLANMSHEIRTPMNSILGFAELLGEEDIDNDERRSYVGIIQSGTKQLLSIISDIIDISKIQAGQLRLAPESIDLDRLFEELVVSFRMELARQGKEHIEIRRCCGCQKLSHRLMIDPDRMNQIMGNLISNAIKFTDHGFIEIGCTISDAEIRFHVKDTGKGISQANQEMIFDRFRQVEESLTRKYTGTGLGLAICKGLVELMGGRIGVVSEPDAGSEFWFTLPR